MAEHVLVWEFWVRPERRTEFERHYGPDGTWAALFRRSPGYLGTLLLHDRAQELRYVTIDRWDDVESYRGFRASHSREYEAIDRLCEALTTREAALGEFSG